MQYELGLCIELIIFSSFSVLACSFVLICYLKFKELRTHEFTIIANIILFDLIYELILLIDGISYLCLQNSSFKLSQLNGMCLSQSFLSEYSAMGSTMWTILVCHSLYLQVKSGVKEFNLVCYYCIGYGVPLIISIIPFFFDDMYGQYTPFDQSNCFFNINNPNVTYNILIFFYIPIWMAFLINSIMICILIKQIQDILSQSGLALENQKKVYNLFTYPGILFICWGIPGIINQFNIHSGIWLFVSFGLNSWIGFLDAYWYCYSCLKNKLEIRNGQFLLRKNECISEAELLKI